tara:strand:- start:185 stop:721 length:537 start_codon:yes stop_codon:yes gene_type:complete
MVLCSIVFAINIYILLGGSLEGTINIQAIINQNDNTSNYSNFNQVPFMTRLLMFLLVTISAGLILSILKFWGNFISLIKDEKYFEIDTIKNLQYISYLLLGIWTLLFIIEFFSDIIFSTSFSTDIIANENNVNENKNTIDSSFSLPPSIFLINGIIFWVLSHIIIEGIKLKKENELTI